MEAKSKHTDKPLWISLDQWLECSFIKIEPEILAVMKDLDRLGFKFRTMSTNGAFFECKKTEAAQ